MSDPQVLNEHATSEVTCGALLGGRIQYAQFRAGYRTGIEPVLLAAAVPAQAGQRVLEAGTGAGAGLLCLLWRSPGLTGFGIELDPELALLARHNLTANGLSATVHTSNVTNVASLGLFDHALANPPWHDEASTVPINTRRACATHQPARGLSDWIGALSKCLRHNGTLTIALPAKQITKAIKLLDQSGLRKVTILPLWPTTCSEAKIVLLQCRFGEGPTRLTAGLTLHEQGKYTEQAEAVLRHGKPLLF